MRLEYITLSYTFTVTSIQLVQKAVHFCVYSFISKKYHLKAYLGMAYLCVWEGIGSMGGHVWGVSPEGISLCMGGGQL